MSYKISVIMPVFNAEDYLPLALKSLIDQTIGYHNIEVIIVDDKSTDNSRTIIQEYCARYANCRAVFCEHNSGAAGRPRNEGLKIASADYIMFLDPDDYYEIDACKWLHDLISRSDVDVVSGYYKKVTSDGTFCMEYPEEYSMLEETTYDLNQSLELILNVRGSFWSKIYKRDLLMQFQTIFPEGIPGQDTVFFCKYLLAAKNFMYTNKHVYNYRIRSKDKVSISYDFKKKFFMGISTCYKEIYSLFCDCGRLNSEDLFKQVISPVPDDYIQKLLTFADLSEIELIEILNEWCWIFEYFNRNDMPYKNEYVEVIATTRRCSDDITVLKVYKCMKKILDYVLDLEQAKVYFLKQIEYKDIRIRELEI